MANDETDFVHLHVHSVYSFLDGAASLKGLAKRSKELGMKAIALTDHNSLGGIPKFITACKGEGIKPLLGVEGYYTKDTSVLSKSADERNALAQRLALEAGVVTEEEVEYIAKNNKKAKKDEKDRIKELVSQFSYITKQYHILFLAMNQNGWNNLVKLQSEAADKCTFNGRFLCDDELIRKYSEDIICTSACIGSYPANMINAGKVEEAERCVRAWKEIFGDRFYLEIQPLNIDKQWRVNLAYMEWSKKYNIKLVATNDVHYVLESDHDDHDTLLCVGTGAFKFQEERMRYSNDFWLRTKEEMEHYFNLQVNSMVEDGMVESAFTYNSIDQFMYMEEVANAMNNTSEIADRCDSDNIRLGSSKPLFPKIVIPHGFTPKEWLTMKAWTNLYKYLSKHPEYNRKEYEQRLIHELHVISTKGFDPYFLTVEEYAQHSESVDNPVGPGRGSAAGSLVLFVIGITKNIDPIQYNLMFERFLTEDRTAPPDIDLDFLDQDIVIHHMEDVYSKPCVSHVGTFGAMGVKSGLKDFGRVLSVSFETANAISKTIDSISDKPSLKFKDLDELQESDKTLWDKFHALEMESPETFRLARKFEGTPRQWGVHASGALITPEPITTYFPTRRDTKKNVTVTLWDKDEIEEMGGINE